MNLTRTFAKSFVFLTVLSMVLWTMGCTNQSTSGAGNSGNTAQSTTPGGDEGAGLGETDNTEEAGSAMGGDQEAGSTTGSDMTVPDSGAGIDVPGAGTETKQE